MRNLAEIEELEQFSRLDLIAKQVVEGFLTGLHRSPYHGFSVEFAEHRHYNTGESTKHIDWKLFGRTEKLFVKRFEEETNLKAHLVLDISSSMLFPYPAGKLHNKLFFSIYCMAALIRLLTSQRDAVGMHFYSDHFEFQAPAKLTSVHTQFLYAELSKLLNRIEDNTSKDIINKPTKSAELLHQLAEALPKRSLIVLFTDMLDYHDPEELFSALKHFTYNKHELILFHVIDNNFEASFNYPFKPHKFIDLETGDVLKLNPSQVKDKYLELHEKHRKEINLRCGHYDIDLNEAIVQNDFREVLLPFLIKRKKLF